MGEESVLGRPPEGPVNKSRAYFKITTSTSFSLPFYGVLESHQKQEQPCGSLLGQTAALGFDQWPAEEQVLT